MRRVGTALRIAALLLAPLLLAAQTLDPDPLYRCRHDGVLRAECCCPQEAVRASDGPQVTPGLCCDIEDRAGPALSARAAPELRFLAPAPIATWNGDDGTAPVVHVPAETVDVVARAGPEVLLLKRVLLI